MAPSKTPQGESFRKLKFFEGVASLRGPSPNSIFWVVGILAEFGDSPFKRAFKN
jgi:hypothetical protein